MSWRRLLGGGLLFAILIAVAGGLFELWRFGASSTAAAARVETQVRLEFDRMTGELSGVAANVASDPDAARALALGPDAARDLFELLDRRVSDAETGSDNVAVTIYDTQGVARAWVGRPSDIRVRDRLAGPSALFVTPSPLGLRLVHTQPIVDREQHRLGSVVAEHVLSPASAGATISASEYVLPTSLGPASLRMRWEGAGDEARENAFVLRAPAGDALVEVSMSPEGIGRARRAWRRHVGAAVLGALGITLLLLIGPILDGRGEAGTRRDLLRRTASALALIAAAAATIWGALAVNASSHAPAQALLLLGGVTAAAVIGLFVVPATRLRVAARGRRTAPAEARARFVLLQLGAGVVVAAVLILFELLLLRAVDPAAVDLRHFSLHPLIPARLELLGGILAWQVAALWASTLILNAALARWRLPDCGDGS